MKSLKKIGETSRETPTPGDLVDEGNMYTLSLLELTILGSLWNRWSDLYNIWLRGLYWASRVSFDIHMTVRYCCVLL
jgi:hypothetical protein